MKKSVRLAVEGLETRETPAAPDLQIESIAFGVPDIAVPGDAGILRIRVRNVGDAPSNPDGSTRTGVHIYLSDSGAAGDMDFELGKLRNRTFKLAVGQAVTMTAFFKVPDLSLPFPAIPEGDYHILVNVDPPNFIDEEWGASTGKINYRFQFGDVGLRKNVDLVADSGGNLVQFKVTGGGTGIISAPGTGTVDLTLNNTTKGSVAQAAGIGALGLRNVAVNSPLRTLSLPRANVSGIIGLSGGVRHLLLNSLGGPNDGASMNIATGLNAPAALIIGHIENANISADAGISTLFVTGSWTDNGSPDILSAPFIKNLYCGGDFEASIGIVAQPYNASGHVLGSARIKGTLRNAFWTIDLGEPTRLNKIHLGNAENWRVSTEGRIANLLVDGDYRNPAMLGSNAIEAGSIGSLTVRGTLSTGPIIANMPDKNDVSINVLSFGTVEELTSLNSGAAGIKKIKAQNWPARTSIEADWIDFIHMDVSGIFSSARFAANLTLPGANPKNNLGLRLFLGRGGSFERQVGTIVGGSSGDFCNWNISRNVGDIETYGTDYWHLTALYVQNLKIGANMSNTVLSLVNGARLISGYGFQNASITTTGKIGSFEQKQGIVFREFLNTNVQATTIDRVIVRDVNTESGTSFFRAREIGSYQRFKNVLPVAPPQSLTTPGNYDQDGIYSVQIVA